MTKQRGYYKIDIGGRERTMHFSMNFWINFTDDLNIGIDQIGEIFSTGIKLSSIRSLIYSALLAHEQEQGNEPDFNKFEVGKWLSDIDADEIQKIVQAMTESRLLGNDLNVGIERNPDQKEEESKKKSE